MSHPNTRVTAAQRQHLEKTEQERIPGNLWTNALWGTPDHKSVKSSHYVLGEIDKLITEIKEKSGTPEFNFGMYQSLRQLRVSVLRNISGEKSCLTSNKPLEVVTKSPSVIETLKEIGYDKICAITMIGSGVIFYHDEFVHNLKMNDVIREANRVFTEDIQEDCTSCPACEHCPICRVEA